jgi:hypothetical protein
MKLLAMACALVALSLTTDTVQAQVPIDTGWDPTTLLPDPARFATELFNNALSSLGRVTTEKLMELVSGLLAGGLITSTPAELSYANGTVRDLWQKLRLVANGGLALVTALGAINLIVNPHIRAPYHGALELIPRVLAGAVLINTSLEWGKFFVDLNNELCTFFAGARVGGNPVPGWETLQQAGASSVLVDLVAAGIYLFMGLLLAGQMLSRLALLDVLIVLAPLALLCWILPQTYGWARLWLTTFFATVFVQSIQVLVLRLGADLSTSLVGLVPGLAADPASAAPGWLATLTLSVAVLQLTRKIPRLMPGYPGGGDDWSPLRYFSVRQVSMLFGGQRGRPRRGGR